MDRLVTNVKNTLGEESIQDFIKTLTYLALIVRRQIPQLQGKLRMMKQPTTSMKKQNNFVRILGQLQNKGNKYNTETKYRKQQMSNKKSNQTILCVIKFFI